MNHALGRYRLCLIVLLLATHSWTQSAGPSFPNPGKTSMSKENQQARVAITHGPGRYNRAACDYALADPRGLDDLPESHRTAPPSSIQRLILSVTLTGQRPASWN